MEENSFPVAATALLSCPDNTGQTLFKVTNENVEDVTLARMVRVCHSVVIFA